MTDATPRKSDLNVRVASAVAMVAVAGTALWLGGYAWFLFVLAVALVCLGEFVRLIWLATASNGKRIGGAFAAFMYVGLAGLLLADMRHQWLHDIDGSIGRVSVLSVVGVVVFTDIGAYFSGRTFGGPKIAPRISPSKTWAGLLGGMVAAAVWGLIALHLFARAVDATEFAQVGINQLNAALSAATLAVVAQSGDFFESWLKRQAGAKDSSNLIPGHGGVFDRVDGLIPVVLLSAYLFRPPF